MTAFLKALDEAAVKWALCMAVLAVWLLLGAWLDGPSETDALQASADISESLAAMHAAANNQQRARVASKE
ncbi:hypothetical protein VLK31_34770 [Variovorax sp. H27-G14]|uniref:hypothetical protein n=1 Tax=Variovorax sp. H27-G14 TaxID=3111914 RepID=UPI0038FC3D68